MSDWMEELERLAELRDKGLLTEEQFEEIRSQIVPSAPKPLKEANEETTRTKTKSRTIDIDEMNKVWERLLDEVFPNLIPPLLKKSQIVEFKNKKFLVEIQYQMVSDWQATRLSQWQSHLSTEYRKVLRQIGDSEIHFVTQGSKELRTQ